MVRSDHSTVDDDFPAVLRTVPELAVPNAVALQDFFDRPDAVLAPGVEESRWSDRTILLSTTISLPSFVRCRSSPFQTPSRCKTSLTGPMPSSRRVLRSRDGRLPCASSRVKP